MSLRVEYGKRFQFRTRLRFPNVYKPYEFFGRVRYQVAFANHDVPMDTLSRLYHPMRELQRASTKLPPVVTEAHGLYDEMCDFFKVLEVRNIPRDVALSGASTFVDVTELHV